MQLVGASYVPKLKLPLPRASRVFAWRQVAALSRLDLRRGIPALAPRGILDCCFVDEGQQAAPSINGVPRREGSRTRSRPRHRVELYRERTATAGEQVCNEMAFHKRDVGTKVNRDAALHNSAWGTQEVSGE